MRPNLLIFILLFTLQSCGNPLEKEIQVASSDGKITISEMEDLRNFIAANSNLSRRYKTNEDIVTVIKKRAERRGEMVKFESTKQETESDLSYNFYMENSGSMYGYIKGQTQFDEALMGLFTEINKQKEKINIAFINDTIYSIDKEFDEFFEYLQPEQIKNIGQTKNSKIAEIVKMVVGEIKDKQQPAILLSDFIFSLEKGGDILDQLSVQKYGVTNILINNKLPEEGYGILIIKLSSAFDGSYYNFKNKPTRLTHNERPYYIWVIDKAERLKYFHKRYDIEKLKGYNNHSLFYSSEYDTPPYASILLNTHTLGSFRNANRNAEVIKYINKVDFQKRGPRLFQYSIAVDLSAVPVQEQYLRNIANYAIRQSKNTNFKLEAVEAIAEIDLHPRDNKQVQNATHLLTLKADNIGTGMHEVNISLLKKLPPWIAASSIEDDSNISKIKGRTFGFKYLIEGVNEAFEQRDNTTDSKEKYFTINFKLER